MHQKLPGMSWLFCSRGHIHKKSSLCPCCFARGDIYTKSLLYVPVFRFVFGTYMPKFLSMSLCFRSRGHIHKKNLLHVPAVSFARTYMLKVSLYVPFYLYNRTFPATFLLYVPLAFPRGTFPTTFLPYVPPTPPPTKHCHNLSSICVLQPAQPHSLLVRIMIPYAIEHFPVRPG